MHAAACCQPSLENSEAAVNGSYVFSMITPDCYALLDIAFKPELVSGALQAREIDSVKHCWATLKRIALRFARVNYF